jgi:hypothetical protein
MEATYSSETSLNFQRTPYVPEVITLSKSKLGHVLLNLWLFFTWMSFSIIYLTDSLLLVWHETVLEWNFEDKMCFTWLYQVSVSPERKQKRLRGLSLWWAGSGWEMFHSCSQWQYHSFSVNLWQCGGTLGSVSLMSASLQIVISPESTPPTANSSQR